MNADERGQGHLARGGAPGRLRGRPRLHTPLVLKMPNRSGDTLPIPERRNRNTRKAGRCAVSPSCHAAIRTAVTWRSVPCRHASRLAEGGGSVGGRAGGAGAPKGRTAEPAPTLRSTEGTCEPAAGPIRARRWSGASRPAGVFFAVLSLAPQRKYQHGNSEGSPFRNVQPVGGHVPIPLRHGIGTCPPYHCVALRELRGLRSTD
jgi:hypothetical protein